MLKTASDLDYDPSTISLVRLLLHKTGTQDRMGKVIFDTNFEKFRQLVNKKKHPDALSVQGMMQLKKREERAALRSFSLAIEVGNRSGDAYAPALTSRDLENAGASAGSTKQRRRPKWTCESACYLQRGLIMLRQGDRAAAEADLRIAALELDSAEAYYHLASLLPADSHCREEYLMLAAIATVQDAARELSVSERTKARRAAEMGSDERTKADHLRWAAEWRFLAEPLPLPGDAET